MNFVHVSLEWKSTSPNMTINMHGDKFYKFRPNNSNYIFGNFQIVITRHYKKYIMSKLFACVQFVHGHIDFIVSFRQDMQPLEYRNIVSCDFNMSIDHG